MGREREYEDNGSWRRVPSNGENDKSVGKLKTLKMNFIYFTILPRAECCLQLKKQQHSISTSDLPAENETTGADKREMVVIMFKKHT